MASIMKALEFKYHKDVVKVVQVDTPVPLKNEVQVKVEYSALDTTLDEVIQRTWTGMFVHKLKTPLYLGWHYSGIITAVGEEAKASFQIGDAVFGHLVYAPSTTAGAFAEYITVAADQLARRPKKVDAKTAAASTTEALTALQALRDYGRLRDDTKAEQTVLIVGAGGGVGSAAVQIAHIMGAHVTAVCSARDVKRVKSYGADLVIPREDYPDPLHVLVTRKFDVIFDTPVVLSPTRALSYLKKGGHYVCTLPTWGLLWGLVASIFRPKGVHMVEVQPKQEDFAQVATWMADEKLLIPIDSTFKVKDMLQAMQRQRERKIGRVSIQVENGWND